MTEAVTIDGHEYEIIEGTAVLVAERYEDGMELRIDGVHSALDGRCWAYLARIGPRGGVRAVTASGDEDGLGMIAIRMLDGRRHIAAVEAYRQEKWGSGVASGGSD